MEKERAKDGSIILLALMILYDFNAHLFNYFNLPMAGLGLSYGTQRYELFWIGYWGLAAILILSLVYWRLYNPD